MRNERKRPYRPVPSSTVQVVLLLFLSVSAVAQEPTLSGALLQRFGYSTGEEAVSEAETEALFAVTESLGETGSLVLAARGIYDYRTDSGTLELEDAYIALYFDDIDLVAGNQIINWGTADGINPSSVINPLIFESFTEDDLRWEQVPAVSATWYAGRAFDITTVVVLDVVPAALDAFAPEPAAEGSDSGAFRPPELSPSNFEYAVKVGTFLAGYDLRASYFYGFEDLPALAFEIEIDPGTLQPIPGSESLVGSFRRVHRYGLAAAGELFSFGVWADAAYVFPESAEQGTGDPAAVTLDLSTDDPRFEAVIGMDYTFPGGLYAEAQYLSFGPGGMPNPYGERPGREPEANHLLLSRLLYPFGLDNTLELRVLADFPNVSAVLLPALTIGLAPATTLRLAASVPVGEVRGFADVFPEEITLTLAAAF